MPKAARVPSTTQRTKILRNSAHAPKSNEARQDLELVRLGRQLDLLAQRYQCARQRFIPIDEKHQKLLERWRQTNPRHSAAQYAGAHREIYDQLSEGVGEHPDHVMNEVDGVSRAIIAIPATSVAGLAVKARLAAFAADDYWDKNDADADWEVLTLRKLIDSVIQVAASSAA